MSALNTGAGDYKSQQHQSIPFAATNCTDTSTTLRNLGPTWLDCNLQQKDSLSAQCSSHYNHLPRGKIHSEQHRAATGSHPSPVLNVDQWDRNLGGQSKLYPFNTSEISYTKCSSSGSGSYSPPSSPKTKRSTDKTDLDGLETNMDLLQEMEAEETSAMISGETHQQKRKMKRFRYMMLPILIERLHNSCTNTE